MRTIFLGLLFCFAGLLRQAHANADLWLRISPATNNASLGELFSWQLTVSNAGPSDATSAQVVDAMPSGFNVFSASSSQGTISQSPTSITLITFSLGTLPAGATATGSLTGSFASAGTFTNSASASATEADPNPANNTAKAVVRCWPQLLQAGPALSESRYLHTATTLPDGRVVLIGGQNPTGAVASAELFNPAAGTFTAAGTMQYARAWHAAALQQDGRVLVSGGFGYGRFPSAERFNPTNLSFSTLGGIMSQARMRHTATTLTNGWVLIAGGYTGSGTTELLAPGSDYFTPGPNLLNAREGHCAELLPDGRVVLLGGYPEATAVAVQACDRYAWDAGNGHFDAAGTLFTNRYNFSTTQLADGRILITGGYLPAWPWNTYSPAAEIYDPSTATTRPITNMTVARSFHTSTRLASGKVLLTGGYSFSGITDSAEIFDPVTETFSPTLRMAFPRAQHTASLLPDGRVLIAGGDTGTNAVAQAEIFDPAAVRSSASLSIGSVSLPEGDSGTQSFVFPVSLSAPLAVPVTVNYTTLSDTADAGDYQPVSGLLTFAPGVTNLTIPVTVFGDTVYEPDQVFCVQLFNPSNAGLAVSRATGTILNDDPYPEISVLAAAQPEGNLRTTNFPVTVVLSRPSEAFVSVEFATVGITATAGTDFIATNGLLVFNGTTTQLVNVAIIGDITPEPDETFSLQLAHPSNGLLGAAQGVQTILNDDGTPGVVDHFAVRLESTTNWSAVPGPVRVTAVDALGEVVTNFSGRVFLMGGLTAIAPQHFGFEEGDFSQWSPLNASSQPGPYQVQMFDVSQPGWPTEAFRLSPNSGADGAQRGVFFDGPRRYYFSVFFAENLESGWNVAGCTAHLVVNNVQLGAAAMPDVYVNQPFRTNVSGYYDAAFAYTGTLAVTFDRPYYQASSLWAYADDAVMSPVSFLSKWSGPFTNGIWSGGATFPLPVNDAAVYVEDVEGHAGKSSGLSVLPSPDLGLKASLSPASSRVGDTLTFTVGITNLGPGDASSVLASNWFSPELQILSATSTRGVCTNLGTNVLCGIPTLAVSQTAILTITARANNTNALVFGASVAAAEPDPVAANNSSQLAFSVGLPGIRCASVTVNAAPGGTNVVFPVTLTGPFTQPVSLTYETWFGFNPPPTDVVPTNGTLVFLPGMTNLNVYVRVLDDGVYQGNQTFALNLGNLANATFLNGNSFTGTVIDNDPPPVFTFNDVALLEGDSGITDAVFTVTLTGSRAIAASVNYATANGTALAGSDYYATNGTLQFPPGTNTQYIHVSVRGNTVNEPDETFFVNLSGPLNATIGRVQAVGTIVNDDAVAGRLDHFAWAPVFSPQTTNRPFAVTLSALDAFNSLVTSYSAPVPISAAAGGLTNLGLQPLLTGNFTNGVWSGYVFLTNTDPSVVLSANDGLEHIGQSNPFAVVPKFPLYVSLPGPVTEGAGTLPDNGIVSFPQAETNDVSVSLFTTNTGQLLVSSGVTIPAGQTSAVFSITVPDNSLLDGTRAAWVFATAAAYQTGAAALTIYDNESAVISLTMPTNVLEGSGTKAGQGQVALSANPDAPIVVSLSSSDPVRFPVPASVTIPAGTNTASFTPNIPDDKYLNWDETVVTTAHVQNWVDGTAATRLRDNENYTFSINYYYQGPWWENMGVLSNALRLTVGGMVVTNTLVYLTSSDPATLRVGPSVLIPAGQSSTLFNLTFVDDFLAESNQLVTLTASAPGFTNGTFSLTVYDDDLQHWGVSVESGTVRTSGVPFSVSATARNLSNTLLNTYKSIIMLYAISSTAPVRLELAASSGYVRGTWTGSIVIDSPVAQDVTLVVTDGLGHSGQSVTFQIVP